ncbi:MAG: pentapeptide repeat-containing protein [Hyphomonadaceae bacterium]|nr:pentapeptide repeat-containing protein [Hyphomonadaceae bacterium]GIK49562.1 MAG: hypothetical protein BroJett013_22590 [Alphaproteobacteria bacterium]
MLTQLRLALCAAAAVSAVWAGQAVAFWPFGEKAAHLELAPAYGGACEDCDLSGRILVGARLTNSVFNGSDFSQAVLMRADASGSAFADANFTEADLRRAKLIEADCPRAVFERATLASVDARNADFSRADFSEADVSRMNFEGALISGADLRTAQGLTQAQLDAACGDHRTRVPEGLRVRRCD